MACIGHRAHTHLFVPPDLLSEVISKLVAVALQDCGLLLAICSDTLLR